MICVIYRAVAFKPYIQVAVSMKAFRVSGIAPFGKVRHNFTIDFVAENKEGAEHQAYSNLGSRHKAKRRAIKIESIEEIDPRTSTEPRILHEFREQIEKAGGLIASSAEE
jgi:ribosomal protein L20A (L18A)